MATEGSKLYTTFLTGEGTKTSMMWNYASEEAQRTDVKAFCDGIVNNGSIFKDVPVSKMEAYIVSTSITEFNID